MSTRISNALRPEGQPSLDQSIRALISLHGLDAVRDATRRLCKGRAGRKEEDDWPRLKQAVAQDADDWLAGRDPTQARTNYSIARAFAEAHPGQSRESTIRRIMGKLSRDREWMWLVTAWKYSNDHRPFADYFRAAEALIEHQAGSPVARWVQTESDAARWQLDRYRLMYGKDPSPDMAMDSIRQAVENPKNALLALLTPDRVPASTSSSASDG